MPRNESGLTILLSIKLLERGQFISLIFHSY
jgi:hypothetical protein